MMIEVAKIMEHNTREADLLARLSENEFCLMLQNTWWDHCRGVADKIQHQLQAVTVYHEDLSLGANVAIEIVDYPQGESDFEQILDSAERAPFNGEAASGSQPAAV